MIILKEVDKTNIWEIVKLDVLDAQQRWVMTAYDSICEAYTILKDGGWVMPLGIYDGDLPVGFVMFTFNNPPQGPDRDFPAENYELSRFYIDKKYQKNGYGKVAIRLAMDYIRTLPYGPADWCWIGWKPDNPVAERLYLSAGFIKTKLHNYDESVGLLSLREGTDITPWLEQ